MTLSLVTVRSDLLAEKPADALPFTHFSSKSSQRLIFESESDEKRWATELITPRDPPFVSNEGI